MTLVTLTLILGLVMLTLGAEALVRGSAALALRLGISPLVIGLTIVAFGTSSPELAVSIEATAQGNSSIALGNVLGSNIANIGLILGVAAIIQPMHIKAVMVRRQIPFMIAVSLLLCLLLVDGSLQLADGLLLCAGLVGFLLYSYRQSPTESAVEVPQISAVSRHKGWLQGLLIAVGLAGLVGGGMLLVDSAVELARYFSIDEAIIGLTIVAIGTSLPELATSIVAALKKESDIAIGNVVGSNIFNILAILGIAALVGPVLGADFEPVDYAVFGAFAAVLLPLCWTGLRIRRIEGALLLVAYGVYMVYIMPAS